VSVTADRVRTSARMFATVFRNPGLRRVNLAHAGSVIGDWAYSTAIAVWVFDRGGAAAVAVLATVRYAVQAVLAPVLSTLADRFDKRRVMIGADVARATLIVAGFVVISTDGPLGAVFALAWAAATVSLAFGPAQASLLPGLASSPSELTAANVVAATIDSMGFIIGPAIAAVLLTVAAVEQVYLINAISFLWSAAVLLAVPAPRDDSTPARAADPTGMLEEVTAGFRTILARRELSLVTALYGLQTIVAGASVVFTVTIALELLDLSDAGVGLVQSMLGVGGLVGGLAALVLAMRGRIATDFGVGVVLWAAPLLFIAAAPTLAIALATMLLLGIAHSIVDINAYTLIQRLAPIGVMGRVFGAVESVVKLGLAMGALIMPLLIGTVGLRAGLAVVGVSATVLALAAIPRLRHLDATVLAPPGLVLLNRVPLLAVLPPVVRERLALALIPNTVPAGATVIEQGAPGDRFWIIERGTAAVSIDGEHIRNLGPGDSFGEIALLRDVPRTATVRAVEDLALQGIERADFLAAVTGHGESNELAESVVDRWLALS
jgi:MFS family permease